MARLLVTGGAGFIGANFVHYWVARHPGDRVVVLDALTYAGNLQSLQSVSEHENYRFVHGDIRDADLLDELMAEEHLDTIVHFAAESHVDRSISGPDVFLDVNITGTHTLLMAARKAWNGLDPATCRFHHVSTDEVYGSLGPEDPPFTERHPYSPNSPYAASKAAADHLVRAYGKTYGIPFTISNCSNNYGPYQYPEKLIPLAIVNLLDGSSIPVYGDGSNVRDWLLVEDHCEGIERILDRAPLGRTYNLGGHSEVSNLNLVQELCALTDREITANPTLLDRFPNAWPARGRPCAEAISFVEDRPGHDRRYAIDASRARRELEFAPTVKLVDGLTRTLRWYFENEVWWRAVMDGSYRSWIQTHYPDS